VWDAEHGAAVEHCVASERAALLWTISVGSIELFTSLHRCGAAHRPTVMAFDLEPCEGVTLLDCCETALAVRDLLATEGLSSCVKTSGIKGLHVFAPINTETDYAATRARAHGIADRLHAQMPDAVIATPTAPRRHKVLADYRVNCEHDTLVCAYSVRAQERPTVSTPVAWEEVQAALDAGDDGLLTFEMSDVLERIAEHGDLFAPVLRERQTLASELTAV
jgi:bifunctional non-homologous end joining protein LigD